MSAGNALAVTLSLVAGVAGTVQIAVMGKLGDRIGVIPAFAFAAAVAAGFGLLAARRSVTGFADAVHQPAWLWLGGLMGAFVVLTITFAGPRLGTTATVAVFLVGQFAAAAVVDRYGLLGVDRIPVTWARVLGLALLTVGAAFTLKK
jgi:transporter family-2 protein